MSNKIKKFFSKKKEEAKFRLNAGGGSLGQGRKLNAVDVPSTSTQKSSKDAYVPPKRKDLSNEAKTAAAAAMARVQKTDDRKFNTSLAAIKAQVKREMEAERQTNESNSKAPEENSETKKPNADSLACDGVYFRCPLIGPDVLPRNEWKNKIKEFLYQQLETDTALTACLIIQNCNGKEKAEQCTETIKKYIENLVKYPEEEKYHKIRMSNKVFCDKVRYVEGALEFLKAAGFQEIELDNELFLIWTKEDMKDEMNLSSLLEGLENAEPLHLELDRNIRVLLPSQARKVELPPDFYRISAEEIKREQQLRTEAMENSLILKTKAMREREEQRFYSRYRFAVIRVKFPNSLFLQGTFNVYEKLVDVFEFVQSCLENECSDFELVGPNATKFSVEDMDKSLFDLRLIPNTILIFQCPVRLDSNNNYLKDELLMLIQEMQI